MNTETVSKSGRETNKALDTEDELLNGNREEKPVDAALTTPPVNNIDKRTEATLNELEHLAGSRAKVMMTLRSDGYYFYVNIPESMDNSDVWELLDRFYEAGYEIKDITCDEGQSETDCTEIILITNSLESLLVTDGGKFVDNNVQTESIKVIATESNLKRGKGKIHRLNDEYGCGNRPDTNARTDLITAAVRDDHELCDHCNWPDDAEEVLHS